MKKLIVSGLLLACTNLAFAHTQGESRVVHYRQSAFAVLASQFQKLVPVVKGEKAYQADEVKAIVHRVAILADLPFEGGFAPGSQGGDAKATIWQGKGFEEKVNTFKVAVKNLEDAANSGNLNQLKVAFGKVGASCKSCHSDYRVQR